MKGFLGEFLGTFILTLFGCCSVAVAVLFGEFYPNPGDAAVATVSFPLAFAAEAFGTFLLVLFIFALTEDCNVGRPSETLQPLFIGLTVSSIIFFIASLTQAGLNPARDFGPRLVAYLMGWGSAALADAVCGWLNGTVHLTGRETNWDAFFKVLMSNLAEQLAAESLPIGHVKVIAENGKQNTSANITGDISTLRFRGTAGCGEHLKLIINARVETTPEHLDELVREALVTTIGDKFETEVTAWKFLQPGRPNPTHRFTETV